MGSVGLGVGQIWSGLSTKRSRDPQFRKLPAAIHEEIAGTNRTTLRRICDEVTAEDIRDAWTDVRRSRVTRSGRNCVQQL